MLPHIDVPDLFAALRELLMQIPRGRVTTYGDLARALGNVKAARWVATCLLDPAWSGELQTHRVVRRDGALGEFVTRHSADKARLLKSEGVDVKNRTVDLARFGIHEFISSRPLEKLAHFQDSLLAHLKLEAPAAIPEFVAGVDVSYAGKEGAGPVRGVAAYALVHVKTGELVWSYTVEQPVNFPYIPGFLAFRELPILLELLNQVRRDDRMAEVLIVDGNGALHERQAGIASHLGVAGDIATIGVGKSLLCGKVKLDGMRKGDVRAVILNGLPVAQALKTSPRGRPIFISPGHLVDLTFAVELAKRLIHGNRVPAPIHHAHAISRTAVQQQSPRRNSRVTNALR